MEPGGARALSQAATDAPRVHDQTGEGLIGEGLTLYVYRRFDPAGLARGAVRADRILDEARETEEPAHLVRVFGISITTSMKYIHAAHPHRLGPVPH
ncbi:hypothetical protein GCM10022384_31610 [Streptomyces marokkonensis]|uniref:Uncharacterized protein n=2 Tax=Streptomyces marokkonensis TaxID=324855 RepID=A0ABP7QCJ9_9ACTN